MVSSTFRLSEPSRSSANLAPCSPPVIGRRKVAKHFIIDITDDGFTWRRDEQKIADEAALDGIYVIRTSLPTDALPAVGAVASYKALENVERVFRGPEHRPADPPVRVWAISGS